MQDKSAGGKTICYSSASHRSHRCCHLWIRLRISIAGKSGKAQVSGPPLYAWFLGSPWVYTANSICFAGLTLVTQTDRQTDRPYCMRNNRPHLVLYIAMRPNNELTCAKWDWSEWIWGYEWGRSFQRQTAAGRTKWLQWWGLQASTSVINKLRMTTD